MKQYKIIKTVKVMPMAWCESYECSPNKSKGDAPGYLIEYEDGHQVWCPAETFEKDSKLIETALDRLRIEYSELRERFRTFDEYTNIGFGKLVEKVGVNQAALLGVQHMLMKNYLEVLESRIADMEANENKQQ